jgi:hypothetical protein
MHPVRPPVPAPRNFAASLGRVAGLAVLCGLAFAPVAAGPGDAPAAGPRPEVYFISPRDGERVTSPVLVRFGLRHLGVAPAGVEFPGTGHHHLVVNAPLPPLDAPIPADEHHRHFGKGQTETSIALPPGRHTLQLLLGDHLHRPHDPPVYSEVITIEVTE